MSEVLERHSRMPRKMLVTGEPQPRDGVKFAGIDPERKEAILKDVLPRIAKGALLDDLAQEHQVAPATLDYWLAGLGEQYKIARRAWIDYKLASTEDGMRNADNPLELARWRDLGKRAEWMASRIIPEQYAEKRELTVKSDEPQTPDAIRERIQMLEGKLGVKTIEHTQEQTNETKNETNPLVTLGVSRAREAA